VQLHKLGQTFGGYQPNVGPPGNVQFSGPTRHRREMARDGVRFAGPVMPALHRLPRRDCRHTAMIAQQRGQRRDLGIGDSLYREGNKEKLHRP
jgi:hypothetical protein